MVRLLKRLFASPATAGSEHTWAPSEASTDEQTAIEIARTSVVRAGGSWTGPILAEYRRSPAGPCWLVRTHGAQGHGVIVTIDDRTARVIASHLLPRVTVVPARSGDGARRWGLRRWPGGQAAEARPRRAD